MAYSRGLTEIDGNFKTEARLVAADVVVDSLVFIDGVPFNVDSADAGSGIALDNGLFANPVAVITSFLPISGVITVDIGSDNFITANSTITMPDVTGFTGGEKVSFVGAIGMTLTPITVDGTGGEVISSDGQPDDTVFDLTNLPRAGIIFTFIFNAVTGKWEV